MHGRRAGPQNPPTAESRLRPEIAFRTGLKREAPSFFVKKLAEFRQFLFAFK
jgi:hypothetical protein